MKPHCFHRSLPLNRRRPKPLPALWTYAAAVLVSVSVVLAGVWITLHFQTP